MRVLKFRTGHVIYNPANGLYLQIPTENHPSPTLNPPLVFDEQIIDNKPPKIGQVPKTISSLFSYNNRVPLYSRYYERDANLIAKPQDPSWNVKFIDGLVKELTESEQVLGSYGVKTSRDMVQILKKYMIDSVRTKLITSLQSDLLAIRMSH